jgi:hypothetical protein
VSVAVKKMEGVEAVEARLNEGKAIVKLKAGNTIQFDQLIKVVRDKAFTPKEARVSVRGDVVSSGTKVQLKVSGTNEVYDLGGAIAEIKNNIGKTLLIEGVIPAPKEKTYQKFIEVKSARPPA